jgi:hypothetical protein
VVRGGLTAAVHGEQGVARVEEGGGSGVRGSGCARHELEKLESRRIEARRGCSARATVAARCQSAGAWAEGGNGVASARRARREGARVALKLGATRGGEVQQEVARGGQKWRAAVLQQRSRAGGRQRKKKGKRKPGVDVKFHKLPGTLM